MECVKCKKLINDNSKFCNNCGTLIISDIECPGCNTQNPADSRFCRNCGKDLKNQESHEDQEPKEMTVTQSVENEKSDIALKKDSKITGFLKGNKKIPKNDSKLLVAAIALVGVLDKATDKSLPQEIANIVKFHSRGATIAALGSGLLPGIGSTTAVVASAGFIWSMYIRINNKIGLSISKNIIKTVAAGVATNLASSAVGALILSTALSITGIGNVGSSAIMGITCYALTLASGFVYLKILTNLFKAGKDPTTLSVDELKNTAKIVMDNENIKELMKDAKEMYKTAKEQGELDNNEEVTIEEIDDGD